MHAIKAISVRTFVRFLLARKSRRSQDEEKARGVQHPKKRHDVVFGIKSDREIDFYTSEVFPVSGYRVTI